LLKSFSRNRVQNGRRKVVCYYSKKKKNTRTRLVISRNFSNAEYESRFKIAPSRHNFEKFAVKVANKDFHAFYHIIITTCCKNFTAIKIKYVVRIFSPQKEIFIGYNS